MTSKTLETQIQEAITLTELLENSAALELQDLVKATALSQEIMSHLLIITAYVKNQELKAFLEEMLLINQKLHNVALVLDDDEIESPNTLLKNLSQVFEKLTNNVVGRTVKSKLPALKHISMIIDNVFPCFETMSCYWSISSREQRIAMVLGATLIVATVGLLIASNVAPALIGISLLPEALMGALYLGKALYGKITEPMKQKYEAKQEISNIKKTLDEQQTEITNEIQNISQHKKMPKLSDIPYAKWNDTKSFDSINNELHMSFNNIEQATKQVFTHSNKPKLEDKQPSHMRKGLKKITKLKDHKDEQSASKSSKPAHRGKTKMRKNHKESD